MKPKFYQNLGPFPLREIASLINSNLQNFEENVTVNDFNSVEKSSVDDLTFLNDRYNFNVTLIKAKSLIISDKSSFNFKDRKNLLIVKDVHYAVAQVSNLFFKDLDKNDINSLNKPNFLHDPNYISNSAIIENGSIFGSNVTIESGVFVGHSCIIGNNVTIKNNSIISNSIIGDDVCIGSNCSIGQPGFGFAIDKIKNQKIFHKGKVVLQNKVNIGANCCIDRGSFSDTIIGENSYFDNLCHVAHNVEVGCNCIFAGQTGIAGSTKIGDFVISGGQVGIGEHVTIGDRVQIAAKSGVISDVNSGETIMGHPAINKFKYLKNYINKYGSKNK